MFVSSTLNAKMFNNVGTLIRRWNVPSKPASSRRTGGTAEATLWGICRPQRRCNARTIYALLSVFEIFFHRRWCSRSKKLACFWGFFISELIYSRKISKFMAVNYDCKFTESRCKECLKILGLIVWNFLRPQFTNLRNKLERLSLASLSS